MRTSGTHSDASLGLIPALLLFLLAMMMIGGVEETLQAIDDLCREAAATVIAWFKAAV